MYRCDLLKIGPGDELVFYNSHTKGGPMAKKRYSAEQIIRLLREVEIHTSKVKTITQAARQIGVTEQHRENMLNGEILPV